MSVEQNILFPAEAKKISKEQKAKRFALLQEELELLSFLKKPVRVLSGGEKQRTALARSLMVPSDFLILDEPFSCLDLKLKKKALNLIKKIFDQDKNSVLFISHSAEEIKWLAQNTFYLKAGELMS